MKELLGTAGVNVVNFLLKVFLTYLFGDFLQFDVDLYYPPMLIFLIFFGYFLHAKYNFKVSGRNNVLKYIIHILVFNLVDFLIFRELLKYLNTYQYVVSIIVTSVLWLFRFFSLKYLVFNSND